MRKLRFWAVFVLFIPGFIETSSYVDIKNSLTNNNVSILDKKTVNLEKTTGIISLNYTYNRTYDDYYHSLSSIKDKKWTKFPITVCINQVPDKYKRTVINAVNEWKVYIPIKITESDNSDISIVLLNNLPTRDKDIVGFANHTYNNGIHKCIIQIRYKTYYSQLENEEIVIHELGHALGLSHSNNKNDIMYKSIKPYKKHIAGKKLITPRDLNTLFLIYYRNKNS